MSADPDGDDALAKQQRLAKRAQRFNNVLPGNRYKELDALRSKQRAAFIQQGLLTSGQTDLGAAIDLRGTCEGMCSEYEREFREFTKEIHPFEATPNRRMDHAKAVAAYTRSDAGAGHGEAAILPSDLRTPQALVRSLDYLMSQILPLQPAPNPNAVNPPAPTARRALGYSAGFIRDRTRAIRKEFAIQSSWGHQEAISCFERIARWHILCLRELQEETGSNTDMHIDSAELGRAFTSLRQHYNDRREESGLDMPCPNEPEFRAYMLIFDLNSKSVAIPISELPSVILDHPLVQLAWQFRQVAQRNFDSQKEGSKLNAELGANMINRFVRLLKQPNVPFLFSCLVEIRLREMRRSAIRALTRAYPRLRQGPVRVDENGQILERRMVLFPTLDTIIGAEEQEDDEPAWDDIIPVSKNPDDESRAVVDRFGIEVYYEQGQPMGALINHASPYNDNKDAPFTRRWKFITQKRGQTPYAEIINGNSCVALDGMGAAAPVASTPWKPPAITQPPPQPVSTFMPPKPPPVVNGGGAFSTGAGAFSGGAFQNNGAANGSASAFAPSGQGAFKPAGAFSDAGAFSSASAFGPPKQSAFGPTSTPAVDSGSAFKPTPKTSVPSTPGPGLAAPSFFDSALKDKALGTTTPKGPPPPSMLAPLAPSQTPVKAPEPLTKRKSFFDPPAEAGPSSLPSTTPKAPPPSSIPSFFPSSTTITQPPPPPPSFSLPTTTPAPTPPKVPSPPRRPPKPIKMKVARELMRTAPGTLRDRLISEVVNSMIATNEPQFSAIVNQYEEARRYTEAKAARDREIKRFSELICDKMIAEHIHVEIKMAYEKEQRIRALVRECALHWRKAVAAAVKARAERERKRKENAALLRTMGLSRSIANFERPSFNGKLSTASCTSRATTIATTQIDEMEVISELQQTQLNQEQLWANGSFLRTTALHVASVVRPNEEDPSPVWETVLLTAEHAGSGVVSQARSWLVDKFMPERGTAFRHRNVTFKCAVEDVRGDIPGSSNTGLVVFEAPLETINTTQRLMNADDAGDRLDASSGRFQQGSRYRPALLLLTWNDEPLDDLIDRLQIVESLAQFENIEVLSLEDAEDLDNRFARVLRRLVPSDPRLTQVVVDLKDVVSRLEPRWHDLLFLAREVLARFPDSAELSSDVITNALTPLYHIARTIDEVMDDVPVSDQSTYDPPPLPRLIIPASSRHTLNGVATCIAEFLSEPAFSHEAHVALVRGPLRQSAANGQPLPIIEVLETIGSYVFETLTPQCVRLDQWMVPPHPAHAAAMLVDKIYSAMSADFAGATTGIAAAGAKEQLAVAANTALPASPTSSTSTFTPINKGTKRSLEEMKASPTLPESAKVKRERVLGLSADVKATMREIAKMDEKWRLMGM